MPRRLHLIHGAPAETAAEARRLLAALDPERVLWVGAGGGPPYRAVPEREVAALLGTDADAVVLDPLVEQGAELLAQAEGLVRGDGALLLRLPPVGARLPPNAALAVFPHGTEAVTTRFRERVVRQLAAAATPPAPVARPAFVPAGSADQERAVELLLAADARAGTPPRLVALLADRGRGKSSALGIALARRAAARRAAGAPAPRVLLSAPAPEQCAEVLRFAGADAGLTPLDPDALAAWPDAAELVVLDEAARLPVALLRAIAERFRGAELWMASTTGGYEGTGRGFVVRFLEWARTVRPVLEVSLAHPIRWAAGDPLEGTVRAALLLDAGPSPLIPSGPATAPPEHRVLDRAALAHDEPLLREVFGLLRHAHYRTTPGDLERLLDAPNLAVHALLAGGQVVAASLVAAEGGLPREAAERYAAGAMRLRGHALADTLMTHSARPRAGELTMIRSVRIAVHPEARRRGLARALVQHVHATHVAELFGTLFGATPELIRFRRSLGYRLVRLGVTRGARSGEPSVAMLRPVSAAAVALVDELERELGWSLPTTLRLLRGSGAVSDPALEAALLAELPVGDEPDAAARGDAVRRYLGSPQPFELAAWALGPWVAERRAPLAGLPASARALIEARVLEELPWPDAARRGGYPSVPAAQRALRPALARLAALTGSAPAGAPP